MRKIKLLSLVSLGLIGSGVIVSTPLILSSCSKNSTLNVTLVKENYATYSAYSHSPSGSTTTSYKTNIYSISFNENIKSTTLSGSWYYGYQSPSPYSNLLSHTNDYWIESNTLYFENLPDQNTSRPSSDSTPWSQLIKVTFVDDSIQNFYTYETTTYYPWESN